MKRLGLTSVSLVFMLCISFVMAQAQSPVDQASQSGLPLLREFTLEPVGPGFTYDFTAQADGPYRFIAAWGSVVGLRLTLTAAGSTPLVKEGNPASVTFQAKQGMQYVLQAGPAGQLGVTSVGQLYGGPSPGAALDTPGTAATPIPIPGTLTPNITAQVLTPGTLLVSVTPIPIPGPLSPDLINKIGRAHV